MERNAAFCAFSEKAHELCCVVASLRAREGGGGGGVFIAPPRVVSCRRDCGVHTYVFPRLRRKRCVCHRESLRDRRGCKQTRLTRRDALQHFSRLNQLGVKARHAVAQGHVRLVLVIMTSRAFAAHGAWNARIAPWTDSGRGLLRVRRDRGERGSPRPIAVAIHLGVFTEMPLPRGRLLQRALPRNKKSAAPVFLPRSYPQSHPSADRTRGRDLASSPAVRRAPRGCESSMIGGHSFARSGRRDF